MDLMTGPVCISLCRDYVILILFYMVLPQCEIDVRFKSYTVSTMSRSWAMRRRLSIA